MPEKWAKKAPNIAQTSAKRAEKSPQNGVKTTTNGCQNDAKMGCQNNPKVITK